MSSVWWCNVWHSIIRIQRCEVLIEFQSSQNKIVDDCNSCFTWFHINQAVLEDPRVTYFMLWRDYAVNGWPLLSDIPLFGFQEVGVAYEPVHLLRCHSKEDDPNDTMTNVWKCAFEPNPEQPGKVVILLWAYFSEYCLGYVILNALTIISMYVYSCPWKQVNVIYYSVKTYKRRVLFFLIIVIWVDGHLGSEIRDKLGSM